MSGIICGWLGGREENSRAVINGMLLSAKGFPDAISSHCIASQAALGSRSRPSPALVHQSEDLCAVIEGTPRWRDASLEKLNRERGSSHALAAGFRRHGKKILDLLHGEFALCIIKPEERYALLAIDRVGIRPLVYAANNGQLVFGSRIASILSHPGIKEEIDPQGIFDYLYFHMTPSPGSIFRGIHKLQPGECIEYSDDDVRRSFYWQIEYSEERASEQNLAAQLRTELDRSVSSCINDQPTGTFLSGGLDSSTVTGIYQSLAGSKVDAYAIGFDADGYDEMAYARASASHFGASLHEYYVTPQDVLDAIPLIASAYDEPFGNASAIPAYYCAKFARENGTACLLAGDGGDEIFAGNARYAKQKLFEFYRHVPGIMKKVLIEPLAFNLPPLRKLKSYIEQANIPMPDRMESYNFLHRSPLDEIFHADFLKQIDPGYPLQNIQSTYNRSNTDSLIKKMLFLDQKITLADNDLRKVNRMCEMAGVEVRYPLLQGNMIEFAAKVPADMLLHGFELRSFFRHALKDFLAAETLDKSKHGFGLPFGLWLNEDPALKEFADSNLHQVKQRGILGETYIENIIHAHQTGHASYYGVMIWLLIMLEQWLSMRHSSTL